MAEQSSPILEVKELKKKYGSSRGITSVNFTVEKGDIYGFIGPNGAGKSTTIRSILGLIFPDSGEVSIFGQDALKKGAELRSRIGFVPSELDYYDGLSVNELFNYSASFYKDTNLDIIKEYSTLLKLDIKRKIADLSLGNRKKVAIIQSLIHQPELLILDEPTSGLDPLIQSRFYNILKAEQDRGCTIFFSSHTLSEVERLCNKVAIIRDGEIIKESHIDELKKIYLKKIKMVLKNSTDSIGDIQGIEDLEVDGNIAEGYYSGDINNLIKQTSKLLLDDLVIEDPNLEEIFMHYYDTKGGK